MKPWVTFFGMPCPTCLWQRSLLTWGRACPGLLSSIEYRENEASRAVREDEMEPLNWAVSCAKKATALELYRGRAGFDKQGSCLMPS